MTWHERYVGVLFMFHPHHCIYCHVLNICQKWPCPLLFRLLDCDNQKNKSHFNIIMMTLMDWTLQGDPGKLLEMETSINIDDAYWYVRDSGQALHDMPFLLTLHPSSSWTCTNLPHQSVSTSGISWQQTETVICHRLRPRRQPNCHVPWLPVIHCNKTQSLESRSDRHSSERLSQLL